MFFKLRRELRQLRKILEIEEDFPHVKYTIREIKSLEDIAPAFIERTEQEGMIYDDVWQWLFDKRRDRRISKYLPTLFKGLDGKVFINYFHLANTAVTGESRSTYEEWEWDSVGDKELVRSFLQHHIDDYSQGEDTSRAKKAVEILFRIEHQSPYSREDLLAITSADFFIEAAQTAMPGAIDIVESWALLGHSRAYELLMKTLNGSNEHVGLMEKWQGITDKLADYPIQVSDLSFNNQDDLKAWLISSSDSSELLIEAFTSVSVSQWLTVTQMLSSRAADALAEKCRERHLSSLLDAMS